MSPIDLLYLKRCTDLALLAGPYARPNPKVGCVIVYKERIIGEGFHEKYGGPHAEVNAINSVSKEDLHLLKDSTLYVSLEPCCHFGKTPPCTNLIIEYKIPKVVIAQVDPTEKVQNKGIQQLRDHGLQVEVSETIAKDLLLEFMVNQFKQRPYIQLKFAKSADHFLGIKNKQIWLTNESSGLLTHKMRAYTDAILIGTNTAIVDNPKLTTRNYPGRSPMRVVLDRTGKIPKEHHLISDNEMTIIITEIYRPDLSAHKEQVLMNFSDELFLEKLLSALFERQIYHLMVEGGGALLRSFSKVKLWDEAVIISTPTILHEGIAAPNLEGMLCKKYHLDDNEVCIILNKNSSQNHGKHYLCS